MSSGDGSGPSARKTLQGVAVAVPAASPPAHEKPAIPVPPSRLPSAPVAPGPVPNPANSLSSTAPRAPRGLPAAHVVEAVGTPPEVRQPSQPAAPPEIRHPSQPAAPPGIRHASQPAAPPQSRQPSQPAAQRGRAKRATPPLSSEPSSQTSVPIPFATPQGQPGHQPQQRQARPGQARPGSRADGAVGDGPIRVVCRQCQRPVWGWKLPFGVSCPIAPHQAHISWLLVGVVASFWMVFAVTVILLVALVA